MTTWKEILKDEIPAEMGKLIDTYEAQMELRKQGKLDEKVFAEARLRKGVYGQRYDNGQRHDGVRTRDLGVPFGRGRQGTRYALGRAGHAAHQDPFMAD